MNGGGHFTPPPPTNGGEYLLSLIQNPHNPPLQHSPTTTNSAVAFMGPTIHVSPPWQINALLQYQTLKLKSGPLPIDGFAHDPQLQYNYNGIGVSDFHGVGNFRCEPSRRMDQWGSGTRQKGSGVSSSELGVKNESVQAMEENVRRDGNVGRKIRLPEQLDHPVPPSGCNLYSVLASDIEESRSKLQSNVVGDGVRDKFKGDGRLTLEEDVADYGRGKSNNPNISHT
ncbi:unnamed protein product [Lupinus luteus]|uniref:Uncharacterized protein n=1 Tax=Lupinus luteus TaxID=3873 RepID=A0AAV1WAU0_LUPLU